MTESEPVNIRTGKLVQSAVAYAARGWHVLPIYEIAPSGHCSCAKGPDCGSPGKHPRTNNGLKGATVDEKQIREWWKRWPLANVAISCGPSGLVVVDVDPRNHGDESMGALEKHHGRLPQTVRACTGGGGSHELFRMPSEREVSTGVLGVGVDIKAAGGYILVTPSNHISGRCYEWDTGGHPRDTEIAELPAWILARLEAPESKQYEAQEDVLAGLLGRCWHLMGKLGKPLGRGMVSAECPWETEHTSGVRGDSSTVIFAPNVGSRLGWLHCKHSHCAQRTLKEMLSVVPAGVMDQARAELGIDPTYTPEADQENQSLPIPENQTGEEWMKLLRYTKELKLTKDPGNVSLILVNEAAWRGCLEYDAFADRMRWARPVPHMPGFAAPQPGDDLADYHVTYVAHWFAKIRSVTFAKASVQDALESAARANTVHPVRSYLDALKWDGVPRAATWLSKYLGAADSEYVHAVGRWWLISAVARIYEPGCQADHMLVLEGNQGIGKSTAARVLGGDWFLPQLPDIRDKDAAGVLQGHWLGEIGELDSFRGAAETRVKDWLSRTVDTFRPAYGRFTVRRPRQCVFIGTTNDESYLGDATGARRFWPVRVTRLATAELRADRDQIWAEARHYYDCGEQWHPLEEMADVVKAEQEQRYMGDELDLKVAMWLDGLTTISVDQGQGDIGEQRDGVTTGDVLKGGLCVSEGDWTRSLQTTVGTALRRLGWELKRKREHGVIVRRYWRPARVNVSTCRPVSTDPMEF